MNIQKAVKAIEAAIGALEKAAGELSIDDSARRQVISAQNDLEDIIEELEAK